MALIRATNFNLMIQLQKKVNQIKNKLACK